MFSLQAHRLRVDILDRNAETDWGAYKFRGVRVDSRCVELVRGIAEAPAYSKCSIAVYKVDNNYDNDNPYEHNIFYMFFPGDILSGGIFGIADVGLQAYVPKPFVGHPEYQRNSKRYGRDSRLGHIFPTVNINKLLKEAKGMFKPNTPDDWLGYVMSSFNAKLYRYSRELEGPADKVNGVLQTLINGNKGELSKELLALHDSGHKWKHPKVEEAVSQLVDLRKLYENKSDEIGSHVVLVSVVPDSGDNPLCLVHRNLKVNRDANFVDSAGSFHQVMRFDDLPLWATMGIMQLQMIENKTNILETVGANHSDTQYFLFDQGDWE